MLLLTDDQANTVCNKQYAALCARANRSPTVSTEINKQNNEFLSKVPSENINRRSNRTHFSSSICVARKTKPFITKLTYIIEYVRRNLLHNVRPETLITIYKVKVISTVLNGPSTWVASRKDMR